MVSVIIPTILKAPEKVFVLSLTNLLRAASVAEVIVVDNTVGKVARDWMAARGVAHAKLVVVDDQPDLCVNPAWNHGVRMASADHVLLLNDDAACSSDLIDGAHAGLLAHPGWGMVSAACVGVSDAALLELDARVDPADILFDEHSPYGYFMMMRKSDYVEVPARLLIWFGDNWQYDSLLRAGLKLAGVTRPVIVHAGAVSAGAVERRDDRFLLEAAEYRWYCDKLDPSYDARRVAISSRIDLLNWAIKTFGYKRYLEIGVGDYDCFLRVSCSYKVSVDPARDSVTCKMTSDEYFSTHDERFDLVFIDGLHCHWQVLRDVANALAVLSDDGMIVLHDCLPTTEEMQRPYNHGFGVPWTGDVWKAVTHVRASMTDVDVWVLDVDYGCGVIRRRPAGVPPRGLLRLPEGVALTYSLYAVSRSELLHVVDVNTLKRELAENICGGVVTVGAIPEVSSTDARQDMIDTTHASYYNSGAWGSNKYAGRRILQCPLDVFLFQEVVADTRPACVIETGVADGGSLLMFASYLDTIAAPPDSLVIGIDITIAGCVNLVAHPRIRLIEGNSTNPEVVARVTEMSGGRRGMVVLDSSHHRDHVLSEMRLYFDMVAVGCFMVVEDTNINGHPVAPGWGPGPFEAVESFLRDNIKFRRDDLWRKNLWSFHQGGWLKRIQE